MPTTRAATAAAAALPSVPEDGPLPSDAAGSSFFAPPPAPPARSSLKRTHSLASLPTPPPTKHKRTRGGRGRASAFSTDESSATEAFARASGGGGPARKRRRTAVSARDTLPSVPLLELAAYASREASVAPSEGAKSASARSAGAASAHGEQLAHIAAAINTARSSVPPSQHASLSAEDAFWMGTRRPGDPADTILESPPGLLTSGRPRVRAPASPPPSHRKPRMAPPPAVVQLLAPPVTPPRRSTRPRSKGKAAAAPVRDSPNNPFLLAESSDSAASPQTSPVGPVTPVAAPAEKATLTYVFRGVKTTVANPLFGVDPSTETNALLPPEHPDFEASEFCPPRLLFPSAPRQPGRKAGKAHEAAAAAALIPRTPSPRRRSPRRHAETDTDEEQLVVHDLRSRLLFRASPDAKTVAARVVQTSEALLKAIGPVRTARR